MKKINEIFATALATAKHYPLVLLSAFLSAIFLILAVEIEYDDEIRVATRVAICKLAFTFNLGICLFFATKVATERFGKSLLFNGIGVLLLVFFYFVILPNDFERNFQPQEYIYIVASYVLAHLAVAFLPFIFIKDREYNFWEYNKKMFENFCISAVFTFVLTAGILLAIAAVDNLFDLNIREKIYLYFGWFSGIFGSCFVFLSFSKNLNNLEKEEQEYPIVVKFFTQFVLIPLLIIYGFILYLYGGKILFSWQLPEGWISFMIMAYSVVGILAFLLVYPLGKVGAKSWVKFFFKIFHFSMLPLLVLLFVAIFTRILEYGFTENRYFVLLFAVWLALVTFYFIFGKKTSIRFIPISLFLFVLFSIAMPFFNAFSVSKRSQEKELRQILAETKIIKEGKINFDAPIPNKKVELIAEKLEFFAERGHKEIVLNLTPKNKEKKMKTLLDKNYLSAWDFKDLFEDIRYDNEAEEYHYGNREDIVFSSSVSLPKGYGNMLILESAFGEVGKIGEDTLSIDDNIIELKRKEGVLKYNIEKGVTNIIKSLKPYSNNSEIESDEVVVSEVLAIKEPAPHIPFSLGNYDFILVPIDISYKKTKKKGIEDISIHKGAIFYKSKK